MAERKFKYLQTEIRHRTEEINHMILIEIEIATKKPTGRTMVIRNGYHYHIYAHSHLYLN